MTTIEIVLSRAMSSAAFAELLLTDTEKALASYELSAAEIDQIRSLPREVFPVFAPENGRTFSIA